MRVTMNNAYPWLYFKAHMLKSTNAAVELAEKKGASAHLAFAKTLLAAKNTRSDLKSERAEKYKNLNYRVLVLLAKKQFAGIEEKSNSFHYGTSPIQRFRDIGAANYSMIKVNGVPMPANEITIDGNKIAMRSQFPTNEGMAKHFEMMLQQKVGVLVVLSSMDDIAKYNLPEYYKKNQSYDGVSVTCKKKVDKNVNGDSRMAVTGVGSLELNHYRMNIRKGEDELNTSVIHVRNWPDRTSPSPEELKGLACLVTKKVEEKYAENQGVCQQPFIHCNAGAGRTGMLTGALALLNNEVISVEQAVLDMRETGTRRMPQNVTQYETLLRLKQLLLSGPAYS
ncbi:protein-tyrosine phosphatase family protein [Enterobacter sp. 22466]|uniref:protein-tyrosine phosphatase family protein n=1 Tax=Enterobacter sp. 22466 TaxID=3453924 RepID=UPI003F82A546